MTTALITGGSGFIGSHLAEALVQRGVKVRCLVRRPQGCAFLEHAGAELIQGDVTQPDTLPPAFAGVDVVYHVAGVILARHHDDYTKVNRQGTYNVAQACAAQRNPPVHVFVSSMAAAGPTPRGTIRTEADPATPVSFYGRSKREGELAVQEFASSVPTTIVRPGIIFGERSLSTAPMFDVIERFRIYPHPGFISPPLTLLYVKDLVEILLLAAERGERLPTGNLNEGTACKGFYFAGRDEFPTYREFGHMIGRALGHSRTMVVPLPSPIPWIAAAVSQTFARLQGVPASFDIDRIRESNGYLVGLFVSSRATASWFRATAIAPRATGDYRKLVSGKWLDRKTPDIRCDEKNA